jgi:hypothetical protein
MTPTTLEQLSRELAATVARSREKAEREALTLQLRQKSSKRLDGGREPITSAPLFGGPQQEELFT